MAELKVIFGSTRPTRAGMPVAEWVADFAKSHDGFSVELIDLARLNLPLLDEPEHPARRAYAHAHTKAWSEVVAAGGCFLFVTPEYDYFPPAALVNAVQVLSQEWAGKPAGIVCYGGISGGLRAAEALRQLLAGVGLLTVPAPVPLPLFSQFLDDRGAFSPNDIVAGALDKLLSQLASMAGRPTV